MQQMLFKAHYKRMHPCVKDHIRTFKPHLRGITGGEILHMHGRRNYRARNTQTLANMALHLGAQNHFRRQCFDLLFDFQIIIRDQRIQPERLGQSPHGARHLAVVTAHANHLETHFIAGDSRRSHRMRAIAKNKHPLASQIGAVNRGGIPGQTQAAVIYHRIQPGDLRNFRDKITRSTYANRDNFGVGLAQFTLEPARCHFARFRIHQHVEMRRTKALNIRRA